MVTRKLVVHLFLLIFYVSIVRTQIETKQSLGRKGKFFVHTLHSASFFKNTEPVRWSATLKGRPSLPQWLQLVQSARHPAIAYLVGTPVTPLRQITVHVIAKSLHSADIKQQFVVISIAEDARFNSATQQILDIHIKNYDAETLIADRSGLIGKLEQAIRETFIGKNTNPYIYSIQPDSNIPEGKQFLARQHKAGAVVSIGSQRGFYSNINSIVRALRTKQSLCARNEQVPINKKFQASFDIDWCLTRLHNVTLLRDFADRETDKAFRNQQVMKLERRKQMESSTIQTTSSPTDMVPLVEPTYSFWDPMLLFPVIAVICIVLILILSAIFFGRREGQQWRDYKTPKEQLEEYVSVRESQRHLRELSVQRQLLLMSRDRSDSVAPSGIHSFLQPKSRASSVRASNNRLAYYNKSSSRLNQDDDAVELLPANTEMVPVGKQTVAEAAKQCGSSLHLYRNPLDSGSDMEPEDNDSLEEK